MMIHEITAQAGKNKSRKRIGRGQGSGWGKQAGRGHKGAKSRSGYSRRIQFEGGQMPYFRRVPKFGFTNVQFRTQFWIVNLGDIMAHEAFKNGGVVTVDLLVAAGLIRDTSRDLKVLAGAGRSGEQASKLGVKLEITASRVSDSVRKLVVDAGGSVSETGTRRDMVRGIDRNADDRSPKNLTKKLRRGGAKKKAPAAAASDDG